MKDKSPTYSLLKSLVELKFITPKGVGKWTSAMAREGVSLMALLRFSAKTYPNRIAIQYEETTITYEELYRKSLSLAYYLSRNYQITKGSKVAMLCRNNIESVMAMAAISRLGAGLYLLNSDMRPVQLAQLLGEEGRYQLIIADEELRNRCLPSELSVEIVTTEELRANDKVWSIDKPKLPRVRVGGVLSVLSGGSSGKYTAASRRPSATAFLPPFIALLKQIGIHRYESVYIPLPFFHGFGLATLLVSLVMGKFTWLTPCFDAEQAAEGMEQLGIEVMPIVPIMISRLLQDPSYSEKLKSLKCLISGGDRLTISQVRLASRALPQARLYNLYGTSEAGFFLLATPEQMKGLDEVPIGKPISGVRCKVCDIGVNGVGTLWVASRWAMQTHKGKWQNTGDLVYKDAEGRYFHRGRADRMVVCAGENVYLDRVEQVIESHPDIAAARAFTSENPRFGSVVEAEVELKPNVQVSKEQLLDWLRSYLSRPEMPHEIYFTSFSLLSTGKRRKR